MFLLPVLYKNGFKGEIVSTFSTNDLCNIMLRDSAHIQEFEAEWRNRKAKRSGAEEYVPLYTMDDALGAIGLFHPCGYEQKIELCPGIQVRFRDVGHLLGSASIEIWIEEEGVSKKIVFSGDVGNSNRPLIKDPQYTDTADYVVMESTYGDRDHVEVWSYTSELAKVIDRTLGRGGNVVIPAFAVGRTQELLYFLRRIKQERLVRSVDNFPVYIDSPLASKATTIFCGDLQGYLDDEALELVKDGTNMFSFPGLRMTESVEESKLLNMDKTPKVIISASGMCDAGRIRHHLKHNLWRPECTILFVGYQADGCLGRRILDGAQRVRLFGEEVAVRARIVRFHGLSSHADRDGLLRWINLYSPKPQQVFVVHGDSQTTENYAETLRELGFDAHSPNYEEVYDLMSNRVAAPGIILEPKAAAVSAGSPAYRRLEDVGQKLLEVIASNKGGTNKDLAKFENQIRALISKWDR